MENQNKKKQSGLKVVVVILSLLLVASIGYIFKITNDSNALLSDFTSVKTEKNKVLDSLLILKTTYEAAISDKTILSENLVAEKEKVESLIVDLQKSKGDAASMSKYRQKFNQLQQNMQSLIAENEELKKSNQNLMVQRDSTIVVASNQRKYLDTLTVKNQSLARKVEKASKLVVVNLKTQTIKEKSSGKQIDTDKASKANKLKISFSIAANEIAESGEKIYYVQIIDSKNNVLGEKKIQDFGTKSLTYSFTSKVAYDNKSVDVVEFLDDKGVPFEKGTYFVNIFDRDQLASKTSFALR